VESVGDSKLLGIQLIDGMDGICNNVGFIPCGFHVEWMEYVHSMWNPCEIN